jgi:hypothetical protein
MSGAPQWRNWQTRHVQGVVGNSPWGFKSLLRHLRRGDEHSSPFSFVLMARPRGKARRHCGAAFTNLRESHA